MKWHDVITDIDMTELTGIIRSIWTAFDFVLLFLIINILLHIFDLSSLIYLVMVNAITAKESIYNNFLASFMLFVQFHSKDKSQRQVLLTKSKSSRAVSSEIA